MVIVLNSVKFTLVMYKILQLTVSIDAAGFMSSAACCKAEQNWYLPGRGCEDRTKNVGVYVYIRTYV